VKPKARGFTLVELAVVISIVALLAALLLASTTRDKSKSQVAMCLSNFRQWALAGQMYSAENKDTLPTDGMGASGDYSPLPYSPSLTGTAAWGTEFDATAWFNVLPTYFNERPLSWYATYQKNYLTGRAGGKIWFCPSASMTDADVATIGGETPHGVGGFFSYGQPIDLNKQVGTATTTTLGSQYAYPTMPKWGGIPKPAITVFLFDQLFNPVSEPYAQNPAESIYNSENPGGRFKVVASRHEAGAVLSFFDGHAAYLKDYYVTNDCNFATSLECYGPSDPVAPDIIWDPAFRVALGY
jgi:prepilin-type N-terminal cleavage/methylation domain-containing protein